MAGWGFLGEKRSWGGVLRVSASDGSEKGSKSASFHFSPTWLMVIISPVKLQFD